MTGPPSSSRRDHTPGRRALWALVGVTSAAIGWPALVVLWRLGGAAVSGDIKLSWLVPPVETLARSGAWAVLIGVLATALAWPAAWVLRRRGWTVAPLFMTPLLLPSYLSYAGLSLLRAPQTVIGDWLEQAAQDGATWAPLVAGRVIAAAGLALWSWPIGAVVLGAALRGIDDSVLESLRLERMSRTRRMLEVLKLARVGVLFSILCVSVVMMGSAVPLHLAQVPTLAINIWFDLMQRPGGAGVWVQAWPLLAIAVASAWYASGTLTRLNLGDTGAERGAHGAGTRGASAGAAVVWGVSVLLPLALFAGSIREAASLERFWAISGEATRASVLVAACVGAAGSGIAMLVSVSARRRGARWCIAALLAAGLVPGVLIGEAVLRALDGLPLTRDLVDTSGALAVGHVTRLACIAALVGCWIAALEPRPVRDLMALDGGHTVMGWWRACRPRHAGAIAAAGLAVFAMSLQEIEAAIVLQPPGVGSLAQTLLGYLHFARVEEMSVAAVYLVSGGIVAGMIAAAAGVWTAKRVA